MNQDSVNRGEDITIGEIRVAKKTAEQNIAAAISVELRNFADETGLCITGVHVDVLDVTAYGVLFQTMLESVTVSWGKV